LFLEKPQKMTLDYDANIIKQIEYLSQGYRQKIRELEEKMAILDLKRLELAKSQLTTEQIFKIKREKFKVKNEIIEINEEKPEKESELKLNTRADIDKLIGQLVIAKKLAPQSFVYNYPIIGSELFDSILTPSKTYDASPTQSIVLEKSSTESVPSIVPESIISETETVQDIVGENEEPLVPEITPPENSRVLPAQNSLESVSLKPTEPNGIPINTPTYEDIFHSSEDSSSSSSEDEISAASEVAEDILPPKSKPFEVVKSSENDEKVNFEKKLESLFKSNSLKTKVFEKIQRSNSESIICQNEHLNKRRATRPKVRRPIRKRQNRNDKDEDFFIITPREKQELPSNMSNSTTNSDLSDVDTDELFE